MSEKLPESGDETTDERTDGGTDASTSLRRRTFTKGTGAGLALASFGAFGSVAAQQDDDSDGEGGERG